MANIATPPEYLTESAKIMREHFKEINEHHKELRNDLVTDHQRAVLYQRFSEEAGNHFLNSGIGGISSNKLADVKCLHLHVGDTLLRGEDANQFGSWALRKLKEQYDIDADGCAGKFIFTFN